MAFENSTVNEYRSASYFNTVLTAIPVDLLKSRIGTIFALMGMTENFTIKPVKYGAENGVLPTAQRLNPVNTATYELPLVRKTVDFQAITSSSQAMDLRTPNFDPNALGAALFNLTLLHGSEDMPMHLWKQFEPDNKKLQAYDKTVAQAASRSLFQKMASDWNGTNPQSAASFGSWQGAIDDSNTYGLIDRSLAQNADFRGQVKTATGTLDLDTHITADQATLMAEGGEPTLACLSTTRWAEIKTQIEDRIHMAQQPGMWSKFGGSYIQFGQTVFVLDPYCGDTVMGMFTPETWDFVYLAGPVATPWERDNSRNATMVMNYDFIIGNICREPRLNLKRTGIS